MKRRESRIRRWMRLLLILALPVLWLGGCGGGLSLIGGGGDFEGSNSSGQPSATAQEVVTLTNQERANQGLGALTWNNTLAKAAQNHAEDMAARGYFSHTSPEGDDTTVRVTALGYNYSWIGENIAYNYRSAADVVEGWMNSEGHRENILNTNFTEIGVGIATNAGGEPYWVQVFGTPHP